MTFETVGAETPARSAIWAIVTRLVVDMSRILNENFREPHHPYREGHRDGRDTGWDHYLGDY
ncbi:hypothetical protein GCM10017559_55020 [Streptosporangium longisporum]|uniref:Uncharacterized protein n=1 Tax=Streptosporangium longisporum TaxID=46187 RepID=A0ABP6KUJ1_9ACTN